MQSCGSGAQWRLNILSLQMCPYLTKKCPGMKLGRKMNEKSLLWTDLVLQMEKQSHRISGLMWQSPPKQPLWQKLRWKI